VPNALVTNPASEGLEKPRTRSLEIVLGLLPLVLGVQLLIWVVYLPAALGGNADFRNCYSSGILFRTGHGHQLYDYAAQKNIQDTLISKTAIGMPYVHPPYEALLFAPISYLRYRSAFLAWMAVNFVLLLGSYGILRKYLWRLYNSWRWLPILFFLGFAPVSGTLLQGQDSLITLFLFSIALSALESGRDALAGCLVGLAAYKFQLVLPITGLFLLWHRWRFVGGACLSSFAAILLSALVSGSGSLFSYVAYVRETSVKFAILMPPSRMPNLRGLVSSLHLGSNLSTALLLVLSLGLVAFVVWRGRKTSTSWQFALAVSAATLVGYHVMMHDLSVLLVPIALFLNEPNNRRLWSATLLWIASGICFFGLGPVVALPLLILLIGQTLRISAATRTLPGTEFSKLTGGTLA